MGIEKLLNSIGLEIVEDDDDEQAGEEINEKDSRDRSETRKQRRVEARESRENREEAEVQAVNIGSKAKVVLVEPIKFTDARKVCRELKNGNVVVVNMEKLNEADSLRVYDVIQGAAFVLEGTIEDISDSVTVVAPHNVDIQTNEAVPKPAAYDGDADLDYGYNS